MLKVTHAKISLFKLLQLYVDYIYALFYGLKKIEVDANISFAKFAELVANIDIDLTYDMLCFQDSEFPSEDIIENNVVLYIYVNVNCITIKKH